jgi:hypothetical protein
MTDVTDGQMAEPGSTPLPDAPDSAAQVENTAEATNAETPETEAPEAPEDADSRKPNGVQKRIAEITREKYDAQREAAAAKAERDLLKAMLDRANGVQPDAAPQVTQAPQGKPTLEQFDSYEDFAEALTNWKVDQRFAQIEAEKQAKEAVSAFEQRVQAFRAKMPDFDAVITAPDLPVTPDMADAIRAFENGPEVAYHLGTNKAEAARIAGLSPVMRIAELGRIAERLAVKPTPNPKPQPPAPPKTVNGLSAAGVKNPDTMSLAEFAEWRRAGGGR